MFLTFCYSSERYHLLSHYCQSLNCGPGPSTHPVYVPVPKPSSYALFAESSWDCKELFFLSCMFCSINSDFLKPVHWFISQLRLSILW